jgi:hypothetical protein
VPKWSKNEFSECNSQGCLYWDGAGVQLPPASPVSRTTNSGIGERIAAFDEIGVTREDFAHLARDRPIAREIRREEHGVWAKSLRANRGHGGMHGKLSSFVGRGADHGAIAAPGNNDRLAAQPRIIALLYRRTKESMSI